MSKNRAKQQHFVPRFYLEHFANSDGLIWTYDTADDKTWSAKASNTAKQANFYTPKDASGSPVDDVEEFLANVESKAASLYPQVLSGEIPQTGDREIFASFIACLYARSPANVCAAAELMGYMVQAASQHIYSDRDAYDAMVDQYDEAHGTTTSQDERDRRFEFISDVGRYELRVAQHAGLMGMVTHDALVPLFYEMSWNLVIVAENTLITSDSPVVRVVDPKTYHPIYGDGGFSNKTTIVSIPLSADRLLQLSWDDEYEGRVFKGTDDACNLFNWQRAYFANRYLYSPCNDDAIRRLGQDHKEKGLRIKMSGQDRLAPVRVKRSLRPKKARSDD